MPRTRRYLRLTSTAILLLIVPALLRAQEDIPLRSWTAPPFWTPPTATAIELTTPVNSGERRSPREALSLPSAPLPFIAISPCRLADTREGSFPAGYGPPSLLAALTRDFVFINRCGIPSSARAVSANLAVTNTLGPGFIVNYPAGGSLPGLPVSSVNYGAGQTIANAAIVALGAGGAATFIAGVSGTDLIIDVNGYYAGTGVVTTLNARSGDVLLAATVPDLTLTPLGQTLTLSANSSSANSSNTLVRRDGSGSFSAGAITASLIGSVTGAASWNVLKIGDTMTGDLVLNPGNINLVTSPSTATSGSILKNGVRFIHDFGSSNTFLGEYAGNFAMTGDSNTGSGARALSGNVTGNSNTATGALSLFHNTTGSGNTANGVEALLGNTTGSENTASGSAALSSNTGGFDNTAIGHSALSSSVSGSFNTGIGAYVLQKSTGTNNIAVGAIAGAGLTAGSYNIDIGNNGLSDDSNTIRIGGEFQTKTFIAGIRGRTTGDANAIPVMIDSNGQLGTLPSSIRIKEDVRDMAETSTRLMQLRPVSFRYKSHRGQSGATQFGLIAEEVEDVMPELVARSADGEVETVMYHQLPALLLNELQKDRRTIESQQAQIEDLKARLERLEARLARREAKAPKEP